jgi:hypothetical protein
MTVKINADTSDGLKFVSDTSGVIDLQSNGTTKASLSTGGVFTTTGQSQVEAVNTPAQVTVNSATATSLAGESNPGQTGGWFYYRLYRGSTEIGARHKAENGGVSSQNYVFAITHIDTPAAGTYTYSIQAYQGSGTHVFGEDGDVEGAVITAHEIL